MAKLSLEYCAGYFDGEGCVYVGFGSGEQVNCLQMKIQIGSTDLAVLEQLQAQFGGSLSKLPKRKVFHKQAWFWRLSAREGEAFAQAILPYSVVKRQQLQIYLKLRKLTFNRGSTRLTKAQIARRELLVAELRGMK